MRIKAAYCPTKQLQPGKQSSKAGSQIEVALILNGVTWIYIHRRADTRVNWTLPVHACLVPAKFAGTGGWFGDTYTCLAATGLRLAIKS